MESSRVSLQVGRLIRSGKFGIGGDDIRFVALTEKSVTEGGGQSRGGGRGQKERGEDHSREEDQVACEVLVKCLRHSSGEGGDR